MARSNGSLIVTSNPSVENQNTLMLAPKVFIFDLQKMPSTHLLIDKIYIPKHLSKTVKLIGNVISSGSRDSSVGITPHYELDGPGIVPVPVAERSKARVYGRSLAGIAGSNPAGGMDVCVVQ